MIMTRIKSDPEHLDSMKLGGGGRRKQSKPIRVFLEDGETEVSKLPAPPQNNAHNEGLIEDMPRSEGEMEVDDNNTQCDLCNESFTTQTALMEHVQTSHAIDDENAQDSYPTKYHQLGMELSQNDVVNNGDSNHNSDIHIGNIEKNSDSQGVPCNGSKTRIFHKDAYCHLCDREFCNKYFLKTHRANKHGIYEESSSPPPAFLPMPLPLSVTTAQSEVRNLIASIPSMADRQRTPTSSAEMPKTPIEIVPQNPLNIASFNPPATPPKTLSTPTKPTGLSKPTGPSSKLTPDMEDYCELCQKHFCNKYYLKKHKQDVHGIMPEPSPSTTGKRGRPPMSGQMGGMPMLGHTPISTLSNLVMPPISGTMSNGSTNIPGLGNVMLINPFAPQVLLQAPQVLGGLPQGFPQHIGTLPQFTTQPATPSSESPKSTTSSTTTTNVSSANVPINNEALRSMGVLNAEAYCELCRKEFCNKYFLRIHKANKHGIFTEEGMSPPAGTGLSGLPLLNVPTLPNAGDLPPGTINITPTNDPESHGIKPEEGKMERSPVGSGEREIEKGEIKQHAAPEEICTLCKKEFGSKYSLKVHMINAHGLTIPDFDLMPPKDNKIRLDKQAGMQGGAMFGNMIAAKLADRVMCDICNKEVCNKYFLKTHKVKVHGMDPAVVEKEINMMSFNSHMRERESPMKNIPIAPMPLVAPTSMGSNQSKPSSPPSGSSTPTSSDAPRPKDEDLLKMGIDPEAYCEICKKEFCSKYFLKTHKQNIHGIKSDNPFGSMMQGPLSFNPMLTPTSDGQLLFSHAHSNNNNKVMSSGNTSPASLPDSEKGKEQRVICELCNKEMCNKYFLRSHMLNKHGINMDFGPIGNPFLQGMPGMPFMPSLDKPLEMPMNLLNPSFLARMHEEMSQPLDLKKPSSPTGMEKKHTENGTKESLPSNMTPSAWHVPAKKEGNMHLSLQKCDICGLMFGEKVTLQLHLIQDHPGQVTVSTKSSSDDKPYLSGNIALSLRKKYQKGRRIRGHFRKLFSNAGNGVQNGSEAGRKKKYRCAYCKVRFASKNECQSHIRSAHPKAKSTSKGNPTEASPMETSEKPVVQAVPLPNGVDNNCKLVMQPFNMEGTGQFAAATVYLPVYEKVDQPMAVTFTLKPKSTEQ